MVEIDIWTEGIADQKFIADILKSWFNMEINESRTSSRSVVFECKNERNIISVRSAGSVSYFIAENGWKNIEKDFSDNRDLGRINLVIIDADDNFIQQRNSVLTTSSGLVNEECLFLWPDNQAHPEKSDLERLLAQIVVDSTTFFNCWNTYEICLNQQQNFFDPNGIFHVPDRKAMLYSYVAAYTGQPSEANEGKRNYTNGLWVLDGDSAALQPLKLFLETHINV